MKEPLTPFHLIGRCIIDLPDNLCFQHEDYVPSLMTEVITKHKKYLNATLNWFWKGWTGEYLLGLCEAHIHYNKKRSGSGEISVADVVIVHNDKKPRGFWNLGKVEKTLPGWDQLIKSAVICVYTNGKETKLFRWPVKLFYPIEISSRIDSSSSIEAPLQEDSHQSDDSIVHEKRPPHQSTRGAALKARDWMLAQSLFDWVIIYELRVLLTYCVSLQFS